MLTDINVLIMPPLVSIIVPCYNAEQYIDDCINSIIQQSYSRWELILIDDCSTDSTFEKINSFCRKDERIKIMRTKAPSGGPSHPRNLGLSMVRGDFVAFLDSDDMWLPTKLEEQIEFALLNNYDFVYSDYEKISHSGKRTNRILRMPSCQSYRDILGSCNIPCLTVLIRTKLIEHRLFRNVGKEDYLFWLHILKAGTVAHNTGKVHALYRENPKSRSSNKIKMVYEQWVILRDFQKIPLFFACYFLVTYVCRGFCKYIR